MVWHKSQIHATQLTAGNSAWVWVWVWVGRRKANPGQTETAKYLSTLHYCRHSAAVQDTPSAVGTRKGIMPGEWVGGLYRRDPVRSAAKNLVT